MQKENKKKTILAAGNSRKSKTNKETKQNKKWKTVRQSVQNILGTFAMRGVGAVLDARAPSCPLAECGLFWVLNKQFCRRGKTRNDARGLGDRRKKKQKQINNNKT